MQQYINDLQRLEKAAKQHWQSSGLDDAATAAWAVIRSCLGALNQIADSQDIITIENVRYDATRALETSTTGTEQYAYGLVVKAACERLNTLDAIQDTNN